jgi:hypothetical protein
MDMNVLVVINKTFGGPELEEEVRHRAQEPDSRFHLMVPIDEADVDRSGGTGVMGGRTTMPAGEYETASSSGTDQAYERAMARLQVAVSRLQELGANVSDSHVGPADPEEAVDEAIERAGPFDELLIATPPAGPSAWIGRDLPSRLEDHTGLSVTAVEAPEEQPPE